MAKINTNVSKIYKILKPTPMLKVKTSEELSATSKNKKECFK